VILFEDAGCKGVGMASRVKECHNMKASAYMLSCWEEHA